MDKRSCTVGPTVTVLSESELKTRRDAVAKALKFINQRVKDNATFSRQDLFGKDQPNRADYVQWSRLVTRFIADEGKIERANERGIPVYHAIEVVEVSQDSVTRHMRREPKEDDTPEDDLLSIAKDESAKALTNGTTAKPASVVVTLEEEEPTVAKLEAPPAAVAQGKEGVSEVDQTDPTLYEMLKALVDVLPNIVTAIHRIEKKAVAIEQKVIFVEKATAAITKDFTDLLALVEDKK